MRTLFMVSSTVILVVGSWWNGVSSVQEFVTTNTDTAVVGNNEDLNVRYARAHLELAKFDLERATQYNSIIPHLVGPDEIQRLKQHVEFDRVRLEQRLKGEKADVKEFCIRAAETALHVARERVNYEQHMSDHEPNKMGEFNVKRAQLVAKLAEINLERTRQYNPDESLLNYIQWQIEDLRYQMSELHQFH